MNKSQYLHDWSNEFILYKHLWWWMHQLSPNLGMNEMWTESAVIFITNAASSTFFFIKRNTPNCVMKLVTKSPSTELNERSSLQSWKYDGTQFFWWPTMTPPYLQQFNWWNLNPLSLTKVWNRAHLFIWFYSSSILFVSKRKTASQRTSQKVEQESEKREK